MRPDEKEIGIHQNIEDLTKKIKLAKALLRIPVKGNRGSGSAHAAAMAGLCIPFCGTHLGHCS